MGDVQEMTMKYLEAKQELFELRMLVEGGQGKNKKKKAAKVCLCVGLHKAVVT